MTEFLILLTYVIEGVGVAGIVFGMLMLVHLGATHSADLTDQAD